MSELPERCYPRDPGAADRVYDPQRAHPEGQTVESRSGAGYAVTEPCR